MIITERQIEEFQQLYIAHGGRALDKEEAAALVHEVVAFVVWLYDLD